MKMPSKKYQKIMKEIKKPRIRYPSESQYDWLKDLLDAYHIADAGVKVELELEEKKTGKKVVCQKGCFACCLNPTVPINQLELMGLSWYVSEVMDDDTFKKVSVQLRNHAESAACPFLLDGACSVYPVRPIACRVFHVYDSPCQPYEDVSITRPEDIVHSHKPYVAWMVSQKMMPHLGVTNKRDQEIQFQQGFMMKVTRDMHTFDWNFFADQAEQIKIVMKEKKDSLN